MSSFNFYLLLQFAVNYFFMLVCSLISFSHLFKYNLVKRKFLDFHVFDLAQTQQKSRIFMVRWRENAER